MLHIRKSGSPGHKGEGSSVDQAFMLSRHVTRSHLCHCHKNTERPRFTDGDIEPRGWNWPRADVALESWELGFESHSLVLESTRGPCAVRPPGADSNGSGVRAAAAAGVPALSHQSPVPSTRLPHLICTTALCSAALFWSGT